MFASECIKILSATEPDTDLHAKLSKFTVAARNVEEHAKCRSSWMPFWSRLADSPKMNSFPAAADVCYADANFGPSNNVANSDSNPIYCKFNSFLFGNTDVAV